MSNDHRQNKRLLRILTSSNATHHSLINPLNKFGKLSRIAFFPNSQMSTQEVLVEFESEHAAEQALNALNGEMLDNFHLCITYATNEKVEMLQKKNAEKELETQKVLAQKGIEIMKEERKSDFTKIEKELIGNDLDKILNQEHEAKPIDVEGLLDKYPELKTHIANPEVFKALYDVFMKEYTKKVEQDSSPLPQEKRIAVSPEQFKEKMKSSKMARKSGKSPSRRERKVSQESYSRSRSRSKSPGIGPRKLDFEGKVDRDVLKKEPKTSQSEIEKSLQNGILYENIPGGETKETQQAILQGKKEEKSPRRRFVYSSQMIENKEINKAFDKTSDYWRLGLAMGVYPDVLLPNSPKENIKNLAEKEM